MKVLVTGANGRLARVLVPGLKGFKVVLSSRDAVETRRVYGAGFKVEEVDLERVSVEGLKKLVKGVDVIVHTAGLVDFNASRERLMSVNAGVAGKLAETGKPIVFISSVSVYDGKSGFYGESKKKGEELVRRSGDYVILRVGMVYGDGFTQGFKSVIGLISKGLVFTLGDGGNHVPLVYYKDVVKTVRFVLKNFKRLKGGCFDVVFQPEPTQRECVETVADLLNVKRKPLKVSLSLARFAGGLALKGDYVRMLSEDRVYANTIKGLKLDYPLRKGLKEFLTSLKF
jgi:nucleoside-diphosphate-sugar epimerase